MVVLGEMIIQKRDPEDLSPRSGPVLVHGTGSIGLRHLSALLACGSKALALPVRQGRTLPPELAHVEIVRSVAEAREHGAVAAVIATDTARHLADATACVDAGMHVLVEKPLSPTVAGVRALADRAKAADRKVMVACCLRFHATVMRFRERLPELGRIHDVRIECQSYLPDWRPQRDYRETYAARADEGGALRDLIHEVDYALWLFGAPTHVYGRLLNTGVLGIQSEEAAALSWESRGASVSLSLDYLTRPSRRMIRAAGQGGTLTADLIAQTVTFAPPGKPEEREATPQDRDAMMVAQTRAFLSDALGEQASHGATLAEGALDVAVCDAARASSESQRACAVPSW